MGSKFSRNKNKKQEDKKAQETKSEAAQTKTEETKTEVEKVEAKADVAAAAVVVEEKKEEKKEDVAAAAAAVVVEEKKEDVAATPAVEENKAEKKEDAELIAEEEKKEEIATVVDEKKEEVAETSEAIAPVEGVVVTKTSPFSPIVGLEQIFSEAHTAHGFQDKPVEQDILDKALDLAYLQPTAYNCSPMRVIYLRSSTSKQKLLDVLDEYAPNNKGQTSEAPVTAIICYDNNYEEQLPYLMPFVPDVKDNVFSKSGHVHAPALQLNSTLQGGYIIMALRALGLDVGPMVAHPEKLHAAFLADDETTKNYTPMFLLNIGYANPEKNYGRAPRLSPSTAKQL